MTNPFFISRSNNGSLARAWGWGWALVWAWVAEATAQKARIPMTRRNEGRPKLPMNLPAPALAGDTNHQGGALCQGTPLPALSPQSGERVAAGRERGSLEASPYRRVKYSGQKRSYLVEHEAGMLETVRLKTSARLLQAGEFKEGEPRFHKARPISVFLSGWRPQCTRYDVEGSLCRRWSAGSDLTVPSPTMVVLS